MARGRRPRDVLKAEGTVFPYTDRPKPVHNIFIFFCYFFSENEPRQTRKKKVFLRALRRTVTVEINLKLKKALRSQSSAKNDRLTIKQNFKYLLMQ